MEDVYSIHMLHLIVCALATSRSIPRLSCRINQSFSEYVEAIEKHNCGVT